VYVRQVARVVGRTQRQIQHPPGLGGPAVKLVDVRQPGEHRDAGRDAVGMPGRRRRRGVAAQLDQRVDPHRQCPRSEGVDGQRPVRLAERGAEVVPGRRQRGQSGVR